MSNLFDQDFKEINLFAHSKFNSNNESQKEYFYVHCEKTMKYYDKIVTQFGIGEIYYKIITEIDSEFNVQKIENSLRKFIFFHDIGKLTEKFQNKLDGEKNKETHSDKGFFILAYELVDQLQKKVISNKEYFLLFILIYTVYKHHSSLENILKDLSFLKFNSENAKIDEIFNNLNLKPDINILKIFENEKFWQKWNSKEYKELFLKISKDSLSFFILVKLFYSLLITSDYYATMEFMEDHEFEISCLNHDLVDKVSKKFHTETTVGEKHNFNPDINNKRDYLLNLDISKLGIELNEDKGENLNILRSKLNIEAETKLENYLSENVTNNVYFLNVPTGGGKTNISLRLALKIMNKHKINKLFYVFPFINIIEQSFDNLGIYFEPDDVTRLDSRYIDPELSEDYETNKVFANYIDQLFFNSPVLFLSHVKFFDLFFRNNKNSNYNFFQLANSVVIIDEIQAYQDEVWTEMSHVLQSFGKFMNTHFIVMSATLPKIGRLSGTEFNFIFNENFSKILFEHQLFKRTEIEPIKTKKENLKKELKSQLNKNKILIVFNKVKDSYVFFEDIMKDKKFKNHEILLLNSTILEERRKYIIDLCQEENQKIILVSTQSIEAGVDIDFDVGFRAYAPWDCIVQVAGRINRNNKKPICKLFVFKDDDFNKVYSEGFKTQITKNKRGFFFDFKTINECKLINTFYEDTIAAIENNNENPFIKNSEGNVADIRNLNLKVIDQEIYLIKGDSVSLFMPINREAEKLWDDFQRLFEFQNNSFKDLIRIKEFRKKLSPFTLNIFDSYSNKGKLSFILAEEMRYGFYYCGNWKDYYSLETGLDSDSFKKAIQSREVLFL